MSKLLGKIVLATAFGLSTLVSYQAAAKTDVVIYNCSSSHYDAEIFAYDEDNHAIMTSHEFISPGGNKTVSCSTSKCYVRFTSECNIACEERYKNTSQSPWYIHVKESGKTSVHSYNFC